MGAHSKDSSGEELFWGRSQPRCLEAVPSSELPSQTEGKDSQAAATCLSALKSREEFFPAACFPGFHSFGVKAGRSPGESWTELIFG